MTTFEPALLTSIFILSGLVFLMIWRKVSAMPERAFTLKKQTVKPEALPVAQSAEMSQLRRQLFQAGLTHPEAVRLFVWAKLGLSVLGLIVGLLALRLIPTLSNLPQLQQIAVLLGAMLPGYYLPTYLVDKRRNAWLKRIEIALPDALDFLLICVEAGQSTDMAVMRLAEEMRAVHPDLAARFHALSEALSIGAEREQAWHKLAQETSNDDLRQLATIIAQSTSMGTPVGQTLRVFSADLRDRHIRKVEEKANVLPTKMTLGTMIFTVPPLLILLLAPAVYRVATAQ